MRIVLLGPPGSGKSALSQKLSTSLGMPVITVHSVMEQAASEQSELGRLAKETMEQSRVSDELLLALLRIQIPRMDLSRGFVLVDFPKNAGQADVLDGMLNDLGAGIELVLNLEVDRDELMERLVGRITCDHCGAEYNRYVNPPMVDGVCDACGARVVRRPDDYEETISNRLRVYEGQMGPLLQYYEIGGKLHRIPADRGIEQAWETVEALIDRLPPSEPPGSVAPAPAESAETGAAGGKPAAAKSGSKKAARDKSPARPAATKKAAASPAAVSKAAPKKAAAKKSSSKKTAPKKAAPEKSTSKPAAGGAAAPKKAAAKKATSGKAAPKKATPKKASAKKAAPKKVAPKKAAPSKPVSKKAVSKKAAAKRPVAKKPLAKKKAAAKKVVKKTAARKASASKVAVKKTSAAKAAAKKAPAAGRPGVSAAKKKAAARKPAAKKAPAAKNPAARKKVAAKAPVAKKKAKASKVARKTTRR
jgi:adenylate kinase